MTDFKAPDADASLGMFDSARQLVPLSPADAAIANSPTPPSILDATLPLAFWLAEPLPDVAAAAVSTPPGSPPNGYAALPPTPPPPSKGCVQLDSLKLRRLRNSHTLSQQEMADDCLRRRYRIGTATIKRAESGRAVRFRIARELARYFGVSVDDLT